MHFVDALCDPSIISQLSNASCLVLSTSDPTNDLSSQNTVLFLLCVAQPFWPHKVLYGQKKGSTIAISRPQWDRCRLAGTCIGQLHFYYFYCRIISKPIAGTRLIYPGLVFLKRAAAASKLIGNVRWIFISDPLSRLESGPDIGASVRDWGEEIEEHCHMSKRQSITSQVWIDHSGIRQTFI